MEANITGTPPMLPDHLHAPELHAGFWQRFAAYLIDCLVLVPVFFVLEAIFIVPLMVEAAKHPQANPAPAFGWMAFVWLMMIVLPWLYFALCESSRLQATPGKLALSLRVTDMYGQRIGFGRATGRWFGKIISGLILNIGYMMAGWTARKQALHDMMADCCVVRRDALAAFHGGDLDDRGRTAVGSGMPGWAIALILLGAFFVFVIPIIAILAAIAIPAYQDYVIRSQIHEGMVLAVPAKISVARFIAEHDGALPADNAAVGLQSPDFISGRFVTQVAVQNGDVVVTYGNRANQRIAGDHLTLHPQGNALNLQWTCGSTDVNAKYLSLACRR